MVLELALGAAVLGGLYYAYKHYTTAAQVAAVKAEVAKLEGEAKTVEASAKTYVDAVLTRIKAKL